MANYNWQHVDQVLELGIGVSCCPKPKEETLSTVWNRIRPAIVGLLNSLQGIHIYVSNMDGRQASVVIEEMGKLSLPIDEYGHLWHMTTNGTFTITVTVDAFFEYPSSIWSFVIPLTLKSTTIAAYFFHLE